MLPETLARLEKHRVDRLDAITERLVGLIESTNPGYLDADVVPLGDLRRSCHGNVDRVLGLLVAGPTTRDPAHDPDYEPARDTGRRRAEQGLPLDDVLRSFRLGGRMIWDDLVDHAAAELDDGELREVGSRLWEVVDQTSAQVAASYHAHERAAVRADEQLRAELWEGLLGGRARDAGFAHEAARILDLPTDGDFLVVLGAGVAPPVAESAMSPHASAWVRRSHGVLGLVVLREDSPREALAALTRLAARSAGRAFGTSVAVPGLAGVEAGFRQASLALRTVGRGGGLVSFDDCLPDALLLSAPDVAERLRAVWLGPVLALPGTEADLLVDTLEAWVRAGGSPTVTAAAVHCHRNTVLNRLHRYGEIAGRVIVDGPPPVELDLALRAHRAARAAGRPAQ